MGSRRQERSRPSQVYESESEFVPRKRAHAPIAAAAAAATALAPTLAALAPLVRVLRAKTVSRSPCDCHRFSALSDSLRETRRTLPDGRKPSVSSIDVDAGVNGSVELGTNSDHELNHTIHSSHVSHICCSILVCFAYNIFMPLTINT